MPNQPIDPKGGPKAAPTLELRLERARRDFEIFSRRAADSEMSPRAREWNRQFARSAKAAMSLAVKAIAWRDEQAKKPPPDEETAKLYRMFGLPLRPQR